MINYLYDLLKSKFTNNIIVNVNGIGCFVTISIVLLSQNCSKIGIQ